MGHTVGQVESAFLIVLLVVVGIGAVVAVITALGMGKDYASIGKGGLSLDVTDRPRAPLPETPAARAEREEEIRQLVEAKSARREARGEPPLDVDAEVAALLAPPPQPARDDSLREEVRQLVIARNERRMRKGEEPVDVEQEVERQLRELGA
jgi:hypothetical protein